MTNGHPHIAIAILNFNGKALMEAYLPTVIATTYPNKSIWIIDNQSTDDSVAWLQRQYPTVGLVQNGGNYGFAKGYNVGLKNIQADYFLIMNNDVEVSPGFIQPVMEAMEADKRIAFAQPKLRWLRKPEYFEYAGAAGGLLDPLGYPLCRGRIFDKVEIDKGQYNDCSYVFWATGACMFARADAFRELGGFYEYFFMHQEEIDLCWRAQTNGYKVLACGNSSAMHLGAASLAKENPRKTYFNFRNNLVMMARNMPVGRLLWVLILRLGLDGIAALTFLFKGEWGSAWAIPKAWIAFVGWWLKKDEKKYPGKRGFIKLDGVSEKPALWMRYFEKGP